MVAKFYANSEFRLYLPRQHVIEVVDADVTLHGTPPIVTVFWSLPSTHPMQATVTLVQASPAAPDVGLID